MGLINNKSINNQHFSKSCAYCNREFTAKNFRQKYCGNTCRTYASQERNGKLNDAQKEIKKMKENISAKAPIGGFDEDLVLNHLRSKFLSSIRFTIFEHGSDLEYVKSYKNGLFAAADEEFGVETVVPYGDDKYILTTTDEETILLAIEMYNGSNVFEGITKNKVKEFPDFPAMHKTTFRTIVSKDKVIQVDCLEL